MTTNHSVPYLDGWKMHQHQGQHGRNSDWNPYRFVEQRHSYTEWMLGWSDRARAVRSCDQDALKLDTLA